MGEGLLRESDRSRNGAVMDAVEIGGKSGLKVEVTISVGTASRWPTSASIFQSCAPSRRPLLASEGFHCTHSPSRTKSVVGTAHDVLEVQSVAVLFASIAATRDFST